jgi:phosphatidylglycerophosphatase A
LAALHPAIEAGILVGLLAAAVAVSGRAQRAFGRPDPPEIVVDEFVSVPITFFLVPFAWHWWVLGFALNRALDVLKPPPIRALQRLPGGWGIVADDVAAAVVANAVVQILARVVF